MTGQQYQFYARHYSRFASELAAEIRREVHGVDFGQTGWRSRSEQERLAELIRARGATDVLDIGCGSGGPSIALAESTGCRLIGVDIEEAGIAQARQQAAASSVTARFEVVDGNKPLPFPANTFDAVLCIDAILHFADRRAVLADWARIARPRGLVIFTDAGVLTGTISNDEVAARAAQGPIVMVPPGFNEAAIPAAGLVLRASDDTTQAVAEIAGGLRQAREKRAARLKESEGEDWFAARQRFLEMTARLAATGRLSRFFYVTEKP